VPAASSAGADAHEVLKPVRRRADHAAVELETMVSRMEGLGWTWEPATRTFGRVNGLRLTVDIAAEHLAELDRLDLPPQRGRRVLDRSGRPDA
jgi:hypothetical protein